MVMGQMPTGDEGFASPGDTHSVGNIKATDAGISFLRAPSAVIEEASYKGTIRALKEAGLTRYSG